MLNRDDVLRPLGGEDNLRMMCEADSFKYIKCSTFQNCYFHTPRWCVKISHRVDTLDGRLRWGLEVKDLKNGFPHHRSSSVIDENLLVRLFEWSTEYTLSF
jgi:hypothetical protein